MKIIAIILFITLTIPSSGWLTNFDEARKVAVEKHRLILLNFSGSDWCGPCIRLRKEIFDNNNFKSFADSGLVLLNADFPRGSKYRLDKEQLRHNELLADKYDPDGKFPLTLLLTADGKVLMEWEGFPALKPAEFVRQIKIVCDANK